MEASAIKRSSKTLAGGTASKSRGGASFHLRGHPYIAIARTMRTFPGLRGVWLLYDFRPLLAVDTFG